MSRWFLTPGVLRINIGQSLALSPENYLKFESLAVVNYPSSGPRYPPQSLIVAFSILIFLLLLILQIVVVKSQVDMVDLVDIVDPKDLVDIVDIVDIVNMVSRLDMMDFDIVMELGAQKFHKCPIFPLCFGSSCWTW